MKSVRKQGPRYSRSLIAVLLATLQPTMGLLATVLLAGCAGAPEQVEEAPVAVDSQLMEDAGRLIERGAPEHLREAVELLRAPARSFPEAQEQAAFAVALFNLLYPQLDESGYLPGSDSFSPYRGAYREILDRAASGQAPLAGATALGEGFFDRVVPALFVARLESVELSGEISASGAYLRLLQQAETQNRGSVLPPYLQGRIYELQGRFDQAAELYRASIRHTDSFYPGQQHLAVLLIREGRAEEAIELLRRSATLLPDDPFLHYTMADAYYQAGRLEEASSAVARVLLEEPDHSSGLLLRARVLIAEGNWNQALRLLNLLLHQHPENREAHLLAARVLYEEALDPEGALELLGEAQTRFPEAPEFPELAGRIYLDTSRNQEALNKLQRALDLQPGRVSTLRLLLENATRMRRWLQAAIYLSQILEQEQSREDLLKAIQIYGSLGDSAQVLYYAEQLYQSNPTVENLVIYVQALLAEGQTGPAASLIEGGLERAETSALRSTLITLQASMIEEQAPEEAMALVREALMIHPKNYTALVKIAELYVEQRELRKASLYLKQAIALDPNNAALRVQLQNIEKALATQSTH